MRIWDIEPSELCRKHLLGEHRDLHAIWSIIVNDKQGYRNHPETKRWEGHLGALRVRHNELVVEMLLRRYKHNSPLSCDMDWWHKNRGSFIQNHYIDTPEEQREMLRKKDCECFTEE